ncbi:MAG: PAS domain S-box protein [Thermodesulfovibrionales bacterium]|nr:PAS domain S-box protein [Thermodesulfovibrionales bacterium]
MKATAKPKRQNRVALKESRRISKNPKTTKKKTALVRAKKELTILNRLARTVTAQLSLQEACNAVVKEISYALKLKVAVLFLQEGDELQLKAIGPNTSYLNPETVPLHRVGECLCGLAAGTGRMIASSNIHKDKRCTWIECKKAGLHSFAAVPLLLGKQHIGVLGIASADHHDFRQAARFLKTAADQLAIYIQNAKLFEQTRTYASQLEQQIAERKHDQEVLHKSEERFRALTENTSDWIWEVDQNGVYTYSSPKVKDLLGYEPDEIIGRTPFDLMSKDKAKRLHEIFNSIVESLKPFAALENVNLHKDGRQVIIETSGIPIFDKNGNFVGYRGIDRDITERKLLEEGIRESEGKYRSLYQEFCGILNAIPDALVLLSSDLKVVWSNEVAAKNMNMSLDDFIGQHCYKVRHGRSEPCEMCSVLECFTSHKPKIIESTTPDGRIWELHVYPVFGDRGEVKGVIEAAHNITERKRAEEALKQHKKELIGRINELEEFYNLAVGRELRMMELKKEIKQLKQLLEKYQIPLPKTTLPIR